MKAYKLLSKLKNGIFKVFFEYTSSVEVVANKQEPA